MFCESAAQRFAVKSIKAGVRGFLGKDCETDEILFAIRAVHTGKRHFTDEVAGLLASDSLSPGPAASRPLHEGLAVREFDMLLRFARGQCSKGIADEMALSARTVSTYHGNIMRKLELHVDSDLTRYALEWELID